MIDKSLNWERSNKFININHQNTLARIKEVIKRADKCILIKASGGLANSNYIIVFENNNKYVLRLYARDKARAESEYELINLLKDKPYMPKYLSYHEDDELIPYPYAIMRYHQGKALSHYLNDKKYFTQLSSIYQDLGRFIKCLQNYDFTNSNLITFTSPIDYIKDKIARQNVIEKLGSKLHDQLKYLISYANNIIDIEQKAIVHGDFKPSNILIMEEDEVLKLSVVLDWEYAHVGHNLNDLATLFRFEDISTNILKYDFAVGYNKHGKKLPENWQLQSKIIDLVNLCDLLDSDQYRLKMDRDIIKIIINNLQYIEQC